MKLDQPWVHDPSTQRVCAVLTRDGAQAFFVGGCVRNALLGEPVTDIDISTDAHPEVVLTLAQEAGIKALPTGIDHGTVTLVVDGIPHEVTTFRKDIATDGRRAVVAFATDIAEDAARRDFTMNAIYAQPDGTVVDPLNGLPDLEARRFRFIGDAETRIREDYLRSLRFFRFHAWYGDPDKGFEPEALSAIANTLDGLQSLSRERVGSEVKKLFKAADPAPAVAVMRQTGVLNVILPGAEDRALAVLVHLEQQLGLGANPMRRLACLGSEGLQARLRLSKQETAELALLRAQIGEVTSAAELGYRHGAQAARDICLLRAAVLEQPISADLEPEIAQGATASFPITASDLLSEYQGPALGYRLRSLETAWVKSGFTLDREHLLSLPE